MKAPLLLSLMLLACLRGGAARGDEANESWVIRTMNRDGSDARDVVFIESFPRLAAPRFSHDGRRIAFEAHGKQPGRALLVDVDGRNLIDLGAGSRPDWSPDDKQIVFQVQNVGRAAIWVQNTDGRGNSWLASGTAPRFSPDGSQIAVCGPLRVFDVLEGTHRDVLPASLGVEETLGCDWSPDGPLLAAVVKRAGGHELVLAKVSDGAAPPRVRLRGGLRGAPAFSPNGKQLAVTIYDPKLAVHRLHVLDVEGDDPPALIPNQQGDCLDPAFSPDGKRLAFACSRQP